MKKRLLFLTLIVNTLVGYSQPFNHAWHFSSNEHYLEVQDVEVLNDTVYTLYSVYGLDSVDANFSNTANDWIYPNNSSSANIALITKHTSSGNYVESFKIIESDYGIHVEHLLIGESGKIILFGRGGGLMTDFNPEGVFTGSYSQMVPGDQFRFVSFYSTGGVYQGHFEYANNSVGFNNAITDDNGNLYLAGYFNGTVDFDFTSGTDIHVSNGNTDGFVMKVGLTNHSYIWTKTIGGTNTDYINYIDYKNGKLLINGEFQSAIIDLDPNAGVYDVSHGSNLNDENQFTTIWDNNGVFESGLSLASYADNESAGVSFDNDGNIYMIGVYYSTDTLNVNPNGSPTYLDTTMVNNNYDTYYISKYNSNLELEWQQSISGSNTLQFPSIEDKSAIKDANAFMLITFSGLDGDLIQRINGGVKDTIVSTSNESGLLIAMNKNSGSFEYFDMFAGDNNDNNYIYFNETFALSNGNLYAIGDFYRAFDFNNYDNTTVLDSAYGGWDESPFMLKLNFNGFVGLNEIESQETEIIVYPNPTNSTITIQSKTTIQQISIIDINGRVVLNQKTNSKVISNLDVSSFNNGVYFIKTIDVQGDLTGCKIIKQ